MPWRATSRYDHLNGGHVRRTVEALHERITASFPGRGLGEVAATLLEVLRWMETDASRSRRPRALLRIIAQVLVVVLVVLSLLAISVAINAAIAQFDSVRAFDWLPILESGINDVVFAGIAIWFLIHLEARWYRQRLLGVLHRLRSIAHVVDMHQMSKDPSALLPSDGVDVAVVSGGLTREQFGQYLDYCSELLSLTGKAAALCAESSNDPLVLETVSEIETLTTSMSRKIWQKITLLHHDERRPHTESLPD